MIRSERRPVATTWLTSFGDLLTLLLCFFLSILSLNPFPATKSSEVPAVERSKQQTGTTLANASKEVKKREFLIYSHSAGADEQAFLKEVRGMLTASNIEQSHSITSVSLEGCSDELEQFEGESWFVSMDRTLSLYRQLIDVGVVSERIVLSSVGPWCKKISSKQNAVQARAVVNLEVSNG